MVNEAIEGRCKVREKCEGGDMMVSAMNQYKEQTGVRNVIRVNDDEEARRASLVATKMKGERLSVDILLRNKNRHIKRRSVKRKRRRC